MKYKPVDKLAVMRLYLEGETVTAISKDTGINRTTINRWITDENWTLRRNQALEEAEEMVQIECKQTILAEKLGVITRDLKLAENIQKGITANLLDADGNVNTLKPRDLDSLAKAAKNASDMAGRIVGVNALDGSGSGMTINISMMGQMPQATGIEVEG